MPQAGKNAGTVAKNKAKKNAREVTMKVCKKSIKELNKRTKKMLQGIRWESMQETQQANM